MRKARRILVMLLAFLICLTVQKELNILNGMALIIDAIMVIVLATVELRRNRNGK